MSERKLTATEQLELDKQFDLIRQANWIDTDNISNRYTMDPTIVKKYQDIISRICSMSNSSQVYDQIMKNLQKKIDGDIHKSSINAVLGASSSFSGNQWGVDDSKIYPMPLYIGRPNSNIREVLTNIQVKQTEAANWLKLAKQRYLPNIISKTHEFSYNFDDSLDVDRNCVMKVLSWEDTKTWWTIMLRVKFQNSFIFMNDENVLKIFGGNGNFFYLSGNLDIKNDDNWSEIENLEFNGFNFVNKLGKVKKLL